ncbi:MAG: SMP-30/gluconolactonase/LRE family protein [Polyangiaceae bacterium]
MRKLLGIMLGCAVLTGCGSDDEAAAPASTTLRWEVDPPTSAASQEQLSLRARLERDGAPLAGKELVLSVQRGGGSVSATSLTTDADGSVDVSWTLGIVPVANEVKLVASEQKQELSAVVDAQLASPLEPTAFGDVNAFLEGASIDGSTEDLAFTDGELVMGAGTTLISLDSTGSVSQWTLTGQPLTGVLGVADDGAGNLYVAAKGALLHVDASKAVTVALDNDGTDPLLSPNYVAMAPNGDVIFSDPCLGKVIRFDPKSSSVVASLSLDYVKRGGPNGIAIDREGHFAYFLTENTPLFCSHPGATLKDNAGLYRVDISAGGLDALEELDAGIGVFGDGIAFDAEDNLYLIVDTREALSLKESAVRVIPAGKQEMRTFLSVSDRVMANLAFGQGAFGETTLYTSLLAVTGFTDPKQRGVQRIETGIKGLPLRGTTQ